MEIDLNYCITEEEESNNVKSGSSNSSISLSSSIFMELWHACAGPQSTLPIKRNIVVYFPQGHLEQLGLLSPLEIPNLQPQVFCRVMGVQLLANKENDEVYTQLSLLPLTGLELRSLEGKGDVDLGSDEEDVMPSKTPHMFCKTLTASDTNTHGGFSVPRRAAEDCFPRLDYKQQRPSQELVAKDLHGTEWRFRHIYRGVPRRHLLTTGWSIFVSQKRLVAGDAVLFLRDESGDLRLGIRRAVRPRTGLPSSVISNQNYQNIISASANAVLSKSTFNVFYGPRTIHADFVVPYQKYIKSVSNLISKNTRFKLKFNADDSPERRGVVTGISDLDPYRWPRSKWRCLRVRWDEDIRSNHQEQISPWDIDHSVSIPPLSINNSPPRLKKHWTSPLATPPDLLISGRRFLDYEDLFRSSKVLQGQENLGHFSALIGYDKVNRSLDFGMSHHQSLAPYGEFVKNNPSTTTYAGFGSPTWSSKVLQGQEISPWRSLAGQPHFAIRVRAKPDHGAKMYQGHSLSSYPLASEEGRNSSFSFMENYPRERVPFGGIQIENRVFQDTDGKAHVQKDLKRKISDFPTKGVDFGSKKDNMSNGNEDECKIFGISLPVNNPVFNSQIGNKRSCTKVHKQGNLVGRAIDLSKLNSYDDLLVELETLFSMEGLLRDKKRWEILYTDSENDTMAVGDDPWNEFCDVVSKIHIYTQEEVEKMNIRVISNDTYSCLEELPTIAGVSKSSSVVLPDSPPTVLSM